MINASCQLQEYNIRRVYIHVFLLSNFPFIPGAWWLISGDHLSATLEKELGLTNEKQMRKTSVSG